MAVESLRAGRRNKRIAFQRLTAEADDYGHPTKNEQWLEVCKAWAAVFYGSGIEQRAAAEESASQTASFEVLANSDTRSISPTDRLCYPIRDANPENWPVWDITAVAEIGLNEGVRITATKVSI